MNEASLPEETIFAQALELDSPAERAVFLDRACGGDWALRAEVEALLSADARTGDLLDLPERPAAPRSRLGTEEPGAVIGPYRLLQDIGEGGMGVVWMAEQTHPVRRKVALKIIKPGMDSRQVIARFEAERQALAMMDHPNIAKVLDAGTTERGRPYFVMELVKGDPITDYCDEHNLTPRERLVLFLSVCHAVQHAHQKGIIHRDLKPSNVLVALYDGEPVPKVIDFGVAKATGQALSVRATLTHDGQLVGTLEYMSPEQASFNAQDVDSRSDIYSLGVLLYELLTGSTPFDRRRIRDAVFDEFLRIIREEEPPRPSTRLSQLSRYEESSPAELALDSSGQAWNTEQELSLATIAACRKTEPASLGRLMKGDLDWIVMKALEKDRSRRYETANGLAMDLQRYLADEPVVACPPSVRYRVRKFVRRNKGPVVAAALILLALVGGIIGTTWGMLRANGAQAVAVNEGKQKEHALAAARHSERDAKDQLFLALWNQARAGRYSRQMGQRLDSLAALTKAARIRPDDRLRDEAIAAMALPDLRLVPGWSSSPQGTTAVAYGGQYQLYARADTQGNISIRTIPEDKEIRRIESGPHTTGGELYFSPDEQFLLSLGGERPLRLWRVSDGQLALHDQPQGCGAHAFSADGRQLAVAQQELVLCYDLATCQEAKRWRLPTSASSLAFHPDSRKLAVGYAAGSLSSVYDAASGAPLIDLPVGKMENQVVAWHPDGERLAVAGSDPRIQIWNVAAKRKVATLEGHAQQVPTMTFHPDGELLVSHSWDGQVLLWDATSGRQLMRLTSVSDPKFSVDGRWLGVTRQGERSDLLEVTPNREYRTLVSSEGVGVGRYGLGDLSADGSLLVVGMDEGACLWNLHNGRELARLPAKTIYVSFDGQASIEEGRVATERARLGLLTCGSDGLMRWPVTSADAAGERLRLGPPRQLSPLRRAWFSRSAAGRTLVAATKEGGVNELVDLETGETRLRLGLHPNGEVRALSADGRWAASCGWHSDRVRLWDASTGRMVHEWVVGKRTYAFFTPDSRGLIIARGDEFSFWDLETLQPTLRLPREVTQFPGWVAFSPDGRLMAVEMSPAVVHLKEASTGRTVAKLEDPYGDRATWQGFTPDGTQLVVVASYARAVHVWDLQAIRTRLKEMNLDWDWPEFSPDVTADAAAKPVAIEVLSGDLVQRALTREQRISRAIEFYRRQVEADPNSADACNNLAWNYLIAPEALRDAKAAVPMAERAARLAPGNRNYRNTLGLAYYRAGRYRDVVQALQANLENHEDRYLSYDLYFLAMCHHRMGEPARARDYYLWAVHWAEAQRDLAAGHIEELSAFRAEAEELLEIDRRKDLQGGAGKRAEKSDTSDP